MSDDGLVGCLLCGRRCRSLGHHLRMAHGMSADVYRDRFQIKRSAPLTSAATRARFQARISESIAAGKLDDHYAQNAARAPVAGKAGAEVKRELQEAGSLVGAGPARTAREVVEAVVAAIEAGAKVATAVKRSSISYTAFHSGLARYPDLKARLEAAKRSR